MKIYCDSSTKEACLVVEGQKPLRFSYKNPVTNNVGEYQAIILALRIIHNQKLKQVELLTDSQLVVEQVNGSWQCRQPHLLPLRDKVRELLAQENATLAWIPRGQNLAGMVLG